MAGISGRERPMVIAPSVTPYKDDLRVDIESAAKLYYALASSGVGIFVSGTTGEMPLLDTREKRILAETALTVSKGRVPVLVGVGGPDPGKVLEEARALAGTGIDTLVVPPPYYYKVPQYMIESFYSWLATRIDTEIIVYTIPSHTGVDIEIETIERLAREHSNIVGVKATVDSSAYQFNLVKSLRSAVPDFLVFSGFDHLLPYNLMLGGDGGIVAGANVAPLLHTRLLPLASSGVERVREELDSLYKLVRLLGLGASVPGVLKTILTSMGVFETALVRPPLPVETEESINIILGYWRESGLYEYFPKPPR